MQTLFFRSSINEWRIMLLLFILRGLRSATRLFYYILRLYSLLFYSVHRRDSHLYLGSFQLCKPSRSVTILCNLDLTDINFLGLTQLIHELLQLRITRHVYFASPIWSIFKLSWYFPWGDNLGLSRLILVNWKLLRILNSSPPTQSGRRHWRLWSAEFVLLLLLILVYLLTAIAVIAFVSRFDASLASSYQVAF